MLEPTDSTDNPNTDSEDTAGAPAGARTPAAKAPRKRAARKAAAQPPEQTTPPEPAASAAQPAPPRKRARKAAPATAPADGPTVDGPAADVPAEAAEPAAPATARRTRKAARPAARAEQPELPTEGDAPETAATAASTDAATDRAAAKPAKAPRKRAAKKAQPTPAASGAAPVSDEAPASDAGTTPSEATTPGEAASPGRTTAAGPSAPAVLFVAPDEATPPKRTRRAAKAVAGPPPAAPEASDAPEPAAATLSVAEDAEDETAEPQDVKEAAVEEATGARRRRRRGRRGRGGAREGEGSDGGDGADEAGGETATSTAHDADDTEGESSDGSEDAGGAEGSGGSSSTRRRRRRRRSGSGNGGGDGEYGDSADGDDGVRGVKGSTRLEAKRQRRREGRDTGRRRPPILSEAEFLARREAVDRVMAVRQSGDRTQIAVLEDDMLVEHFVTRAGATSAANSSVGNVYLGRVQNVLPSMEAAFVDIGKGRNGVLYAGEVNWEAAGLEGKSRNIESALSSGDVVLVQVTKDPIGHKGARLTSQISLPGRFLVYVPGGGMTGISRKLPDTERHRLKAILKKIVPEDAGVIIRTAAEGASEEELTHDVERLKTQWETIAKKAENTKGAPTLVHGEPDLAIRVVRDVFNEDFSKLVVQGEQAWQTISEYVGAVAPDLVDRVSRHTTDTDLFHDLRVDEQLAKALDRKVWLPSGGSLIIDRTEAMVVIDVNTGKFVGTGGNLEQTVTRNNLEAAEEIVRQLRLRDVGGIVVIDFIDMVLESNRELVLRRLTECLGRDRTKHQVAEVTSLGLVQMTRKRVGEGLLEAFSEPCPTCNGRGVLVHGEPVDKQSGADGSGGADGGDRSKSKRRRGGAKKSAEPAAEEPPEDPAVRERRLAAMAAIHKAAHHEDGELAGELEIEAATAVLDAEPVDMSSYLDSYAGSPGALNSHADPAVNASESTGAESTGSESEPGSAASPEPRPEPETGSEVAGYESEPAGSVPEPAGSVPEPVATAPVATAPARPRRRRAASRPAGPPTTDEVTG